MTFPVEGRGTLISDNEAYDINVCSIAELEIGMTDI